VLIQGGAEFSVDDRVPRRDLLRIQIGFQAGFACGIGGRPDDKGFEFRNRVADPSGR
jgi:hypothetical protein